MLTQLLSGAQRQSSLSWRLTSCPSHSSTEISERQSPSCSICQLYPHRGMGQFRPDRDNARLYPAWPCVGTLCFTNAEQSGQPNAGYGLHPTHRGCQPFLPPCQLGWRTPELYWALHLQTDRALVSPARCCPYRASWQQGPQKRDLCKLLMDRSWGQLSLEPVQATCL